MSTEAQVGQPSVVARNVPVPCFGHGGHGQWPQVGPGGQPVVELGAPRPASSVPDCPHPWAQQQVASWPAGFAPTAAPSHVTHGWLVGLVAVGTAAMALDHGSCVSQGSTAGSPVLQSWTVLA